MLLVISLAITSMLVALAATSPPRFVIMSLWILPIPYWWNWGLQDTFSTPIGTLNIIAIQLFGLCIACIVTIFLNPNTALTHIRTYLPYLAFLLFAALSIVYAPSGSYGLRMLAKLSAPVLFAVVVDISAGLGLTPERLHHAILGSALLLLALAICAWMLGIGTDPNAVFSGLTGLAPPGAGPTVFAATMLPAAMLALGLFLERRNTRLLGLFLLFSLAILCTLQRTCVAALFAGTSLVLFASTRGLSRYALPLASVPGLALVLVQNSAFRHRMFYDNLTTDAILDNPKAALSAVNSSGRFDLWKDVLDRFFEPHPVFGSGVGATQEFLYEQHGGIGVVHSEYVRLLCELGIAGLILFVLALVAFFVSLYSRARRAKPMSHGGFAAGAMGAIVAYAVFDTADNGFDMVSQMAIFVFGMLALALHYPQHLDSPQTSERYPARGPMGFSNLMN